MKKKVLLIIVIILILLICSMIGILTFIKQRDNEISLVQDEVIIEYGETYNPTLDELIDLNKFNFINTEKIEIASFIENEDGKEYPSVGEYEITVKYKDRDLLQKVKVIDTVSPELSIQESIEIPNGTDLSTYNFKDFIKTSDLSELKEYNIDFSNVNSSVSGKYTAKISIEDIYSNKTEKEFEIVIPEVEIAATEENITSEQTSNNSVKVNSSASSQKKTTTASTSQVSKTTPSKSTTSSQDVQSTTPKPSNETHTEQKTVRCTNNHNHGMDVGNSGQWFSSKSSAIAYYENKINDLDRKVNSGEITYEKYLKDCPYGYEVWSCMYCNKWTINFYYR